MASCSICSQNVAHDYRRALFVKVNWVQFNLLAISSRLASLHKQRCFSLLLKYFLRAVTLAVCLYAGPQIWSFWFFKKIFSLFDHPLRNRFCDSRYWKTYLKALGTTLLYRVSEQNWKWEPPEYFKKHKHIRQIIVNLRKITSIYRNANSIQNLNFFLAN